MTLPYLSAQHIVIMPRPPIKGTDRVHNKYHTGVCWYMCVNVSCVFLLEYCCVHCVCLLYVCVLVDVRYVCAGMCVCYMCTMYAVCLCCVYAVFFIKYLLPI